MRRDGLGWLEVESSESFGNHASRLEKLSNTVRYQGLILANDERNACYENFCWTGYIA